MKSYTPHTMVELSECLANLTKDSKIIGGGTDLIIRLNQGIVEPDALCYLGHIQELKEIYEDENSICIGAYCTMTQIENNELVNQYLLALKHAAMDVGSLQIRNNGTIGGNIGNASPAGDLIPVLFMYEAQVEIVSPMGKRIEPIEKVVLGPGKTCLAYNEAITQIIITKPNYQSAFVKLGFRKKVTIARIGVTVGVEMENNLIKTAKMFVGAISLTPVEVKKAEEYMVGKPLNDELIDHVGKILSDLIMEITPEKFDRDYKVYASKGVVEDVFKLLKQ